MTSDAEGDQEQPETDEPETDEAETDEAQTDEAETEEPETEPSVDTEPLERSERALDEARDAAHEALSNPVPDEDVDFENVEQNTDPEADDNAVPRPN